MQLIGYRPECPTKVADNIHDYRDLYSENSSYNDYKTTHDSITKSRVFPNRYIDKHTWKTYGYKTNYVTSFEETSKCLPKKMRQGNVSPPSRREQSGSLVGKVYKPKDAIMLPIITNITTSKKSDATWNNPYVVR
jgi:hypothetical protein